MEGWRRLFVVLCWLVGACVGLVAFSQYPDKARDDDVWSCSLRDTSVSAERARQLLAIGHIPLAENYEFPEGNLPISGECADDLQAVANGRMRTKRIAAWRADTFQAAWYAAIALAIVFAVGRALGWVWRGFRPARD